MRGLQVIDHWTDDRHRARSRRPGRGGERAAFHGRLALLRPPWIRIPMPRADNKGATTQVYEALLDVDSNLAIVPQLALAWKPLDPTTWEFELRPDVTLSRRHTVHRR